MKNKQNRIVYIAGKIADTSIDKRKINLLKAKVIAAILVAKGIDFFCAHTHSSDVEFLQPSEYWYELDLKFLDVCDVILFLEGWETSKGCQLEKEYAERKNKKIFYSLEELLRYYKKI